MFDLIKKILASESKSETDLVPDEPKTHIASCVLLLEASHIDNECHDDEMDHIIETLKTKFNLSHDYVEELVALAHEERKNAIDLWQFTNEINQHYSLEEKITVMEDVWRIIHVDGQLDKYEDYFAHKVANLLRLNHKQMIDAKLKARVQLQDGDVKE